MKISAVRPRLPNSKSFTRTHTLLARVFLFFSSLSFVLGVFTLHARLPAYLSYFERHISIVSHISQCPTA